jgi:hypothetical protein
MRAFLLCSVVALSVGAGFVACNPNSIGRQCVNPTNAAPLGTQISSPALECPSRLCLIQPNNGSGGDADGGVGVARSTCTAECSNNGDCDAETRDSCIDVDGKISKAGTRLNYVCAVATVTDPRYCCKKVCICPLDLVDGVNKAPDGGVITPFACDPKVNTNITCDNVKH